MPLNDIIAQGRKVDGHRPWPRVVVSPDAWGVAATRIAAGEATLLGLWGDAGAVHMAIIDEASGEISIATIECPHGRFPSVASDLCPGHTTRARHPILVRIAGGWFAGPKAVARPRLLGRKASTRQRHRGAARVRPL